MNKAILTLLAIGFLAMSQCHASQHDTYNIDDRGVVSKGASKLGKTGDTKSFNSRKPSNAEMFGGEPTQILKSKNSFSQW